MYSYKKRLHSDAKNERALLKHDVMYLFKSNYMRICILLALLWLLPSAYAEGIKWDESSIVKADIDCDGLLDEAKLGYIENRVRLAVTFGAKRAAQTIEFGLGESGYQSSLCGTIAVLKVEDMDYDLKEIFSENPEGFKQSKTRKGLNVSAGDCDSMHIFWNHKTNHINWWRL